MSVTGAKKYSIYANENRGRVLLLFLLFLASLYLFYTSGIRGLSLACAIPVVALYAFIAFKYKMFTFWTLFVVNYFVMFLNRYQYMKENDTMDCLKDPSVVMLDDNFVFQIY